MKNQVLTSLIAFGFAALLGSIPAAAQAKQSATIPFSFQAGGVEYPEGNYKLERLTGLHVIKFTNVTNGRSAMVNAPIQTGLANHGSGKLVFSPNGDGMKLSEIWFEGYPGMLTVRSRNEASAKVAVSLK